MALKKTNKKDEAAAPKKTKATPVVKQTKASAKTPEKLTDAQKKEKALEKFHPDNIDYLKKVFGLDLKSSSVKYSVVEDIAAGRITEPVELRLKPMAYDKDKKEQVEMSPIKAVASVRIVFPYEKDTFKQLPVDSEHKMAFNAFPCYEMLVKSNARNFSEEVVENTAKPEAVQFTKEQVKALEGLGIREDRLYNGSYNALSMAEKESIFKGEVFDVTGTVRVSDGMDSAIFVDINGKAKMNTTPKGEVYTSFEPQYNVERGKANVIDLLKIRRIGAVELDFFERTPEGKIKKDVYDSPIINKAGRQLIDYGVSFTPVDGFIHQRHYDDKTKKFVDTIEKKKYQVSVVNGGLCITSMVKVNDLDQDGNKIMTNINGKEVEKYHYEVKDVRMKDGKVFVNGELLEPASPKDLENYKRGIGGVFKGAKWTEYNEQGKAKVITYDAYAVPNNQKNGFAKVFSPDTSAKLVEELAEKKKAVKRQNFSRGF